MGFTINKVLTGYIIADLLFLLGGVILLLGSRLGEASLHHERNVENVMRSLLIPRCPIIPSLANAISVFATFLCSIPVIVFPQSGRWLQVHGWLLVFTGIFTLSLGLSVWYEALRTRSTLQPMWSRETGDIQGLLQKRFDCCGFENSTSPLYHYDSTCMSDLLAAQKPGCIGPMSDYAFSFFGNISTATFGIVVIDTVLLLCVAMLFKDRKDRTRYRLIDEKYELGMRQT
ncbi:tetraspanin [Nannizzia gypsea CBS 118893]|uniref:Tetraspanin n=1 Tax=Arthroderma gypseum (strain ATCC MYA-4604 / CBS 118893) TaxID=535722 RepID=E5R0J1_ARTGP|nr:tetraspanin [Nannizzia gypsea CBS 118893]EFQ98335.1 tetraspanin [Nannizzia gypsea CBS 118893]